MSWLFLCVLPLAVPCSSTNVRAKCVANSRCLVQNKTSEIACVQSCFEENGGCERDQVCINTVGECTADNYPYQCATQVKCLAPNGVCVCVRACMRTCVCDITLRYRVLHCIMLGLRCMIDWGIHCKATCSVLCMCMTLYKINYFQMYHPSVLLDGSIVTVALTVVQLVRVF